jgi:Dyp-type peroxidase family
MPLNLQNDQEPIDQDAPGYQDFLEDLQGNILNGHGRDHAVHIFLSFLPRGEQEVKNWIAEFASTKVTSAKSQLEASKRYKQSKIDAGLFAHFSLSASGYDYLGIPKSKQPQGSNPRNRSLSHDDYADSFQAGQKKRQSALFDPPAVNWDEGFQETIDALIILAADHPADLTAAELEVRKQLKDIAIIRTVEIGQTLRCKFEATVNGSQVQEEFGSVVEHFGYADGVSQPIFLKKALEGSTSNYWNQGAPLQILLIDDPNGTPGVSFGSFLVFRKLEQNVRAFRTAVTKLSEQLGLSKELVGAMAVGRYEDGTPLVLQASCGGWAEFDTPTISNDFNYTGDPDGLKCPFHAHTRKSNPRLESVNPEGPFAKDDKEELDHRIARRAMTYGGSLNTSKVLSDLPTRGVGLLFMCYQADIWEQFEFIQRFWCNNPNFLEPGRSQTNSKCDKTGLDAIIGQKQGDLCDPLVKEVPYPPNNWPNEWNKPMVKPEIEPEHQFTQFVTMKGGEYFFSPSLTFLKDLTKN